MHNVPLFCSVTPKSLFSEDRKSYKISDFYLFSLHSYSSFRELLSDPFEKKQASRCCHDTLFWWNFRPFCFVSHLPLLFFVASLLIIFRSLTKLHAALEHANGCWCWGVLSSLLAINKIGILDKINKRLLNL